MRLTLSRPVNWQFVLDRLLLLAAVFLAVFVWLPWFARFATPIGGDWRTTWQPAMGEMFAGRTPYTNPDFRSPPWVLLILAPLNLLPYPVNTLIISAMAIITYIVVLRRMGASPLIMVAFLATPQFWVGVVWGNVDWLVALGLVLPPQIGLFLVLLKPQVGAAIALFWLVEAWRRGKLREMARVFAPVSAAFALSFLLYGAWPLRFVDALAEQSNVKVWPTVLPIGVLLLYKAIKEQRFNMAILSSIFFAPYLGMQSIPTAVLGLLPSKTDTLLALVTLWAAWLLYWL